MPLKVLFFDNHILVVEKPASVLTQPTKSSRDSLEQRAKLWLKDKLQKKGSIFLHAVHRLDKPVSGIVLFAKTSKALKRLQQQVRDKQIEKTYMAEVEGIVQSKRKELKSFLVHESFRSKVVKKETSKAKEAKLIYEVIERKNHRTLLKVQLITGRYHQIRSQLSSIGHPIVGDRKYGATSFEKGEIHLHHSKLCFFHPVSKKKLVFNSTPPF